MAIQHSRSDPTEPSLPEWIQTAYEPLAAEYESGTDELSEAEAKQLLVQSDHIEGETDAEYVLERLLQRGWLYEVEGQIRNPDRDE
jgi:hypothetical protein